MYCYRCGKSLSPDSLYCNACGANLRPGDQSNRISPAPAQAQVSPAVENDLRVGESLSQSERIIFRTRPAFYSVGVAYLFAASFSLLAAGVIGYFGGPLWASLALAALFFCAPFYRHIQRNRVVYTLTSTKIEIEYGLLSKTIRNIPLRNIQDVTTSATLGERLIGMGDVIIDSAAEAGKIPMRNIRDPRKYADLILNQLHHWN